VDEPIFLFHIGTEGRGRGELMRPIGVEVAEGSVLVSDMDNARISLFRHSDAAFIRYIGSRLSSPAGMLVVEGMLYVAVRRGVSVFRLQDGTILHALVVRVTSVSMTRLEDYPDQLSGITRRAGYDWHAHRNIYPPHWIRRCWSGPS
jgi:hypothetical protein